jgi:PIN domain nuclease of toxin-antitoxin system
VRCLLDTGVFVWSLGATARLNAPATEVLTSTDTQIYLSPVSSWEIAIKYALGKIVLPNVPAEFVPSGMRDLGIGTLDVTHAHALAAGQLPPHHRDPFDRMLIAQARSERMVLLTTDQFFKAYDVEMLFCGK